MLPLIPQKGSEDNPVSNQFNKIKNQLRNYSNYVNSDQQYHHNTQPSDDFLTRKNIDSYQNTHKSVRNISVINPQLKKQYNLCKLKQQLSRMKPTYNICNNQKCKVCKPLITQRKQIKYYHHKKIKPPLPSFPALKSSSVKKYPNQPQYYQNRPRNRRVRSVIEVEPHNLNDIYIYEQPMIKEKKGYYQQHISNKLPARHYYTEPEETDRRIFQINGRLYESTDQKQISEEVQEMPVPIRRLKKPQVVQLIQPIIRYSQKWKDEQVEKVKRREQLNKWVNQYINYQTVFFMESRGIKINFNANINNQSQNKGQNIQRYKLKSINKQIQKLSMNQEKYDPQELISNFLQLVTIQPTEVKIQKKQVKIKQQDKKKQQIDEIYEIKFPAIAEVSQSINKYESLTGQINIEHLKKSKSYFREYCDQLAKQYLYFGEYDHTKSQRTGFGVLVTKNFILEGKWAKGFITQGVQLKAKFMYKGQFKNNKKHGDGTCKWVNGQSYVGQWQNGLKNGHGFWTSFDGKETYSGEWKKGKVTGHGEYSIKNKSLYKGFFVDFIKHGHGFQQFFNGDKYQGEYVNGIPSGKGIYSWQCGLRYQGQFRKSCRQGKGSLKKLELFQIEGNFQNQKPHGICRLKLTNGDIFNGKYVFGQKYGFGTLQYNNSSLIEQGFWNHDVLQEKLGLQIFLKKNS